MRRPHHAQSGSVLLFSMGILLTLAVLSGVVLNILGARYRQSYQTAAWHNALLHAESGVDKAVVETKKIIRYSATSGEAPWVGWTQTAPIGSAPKYVRLYTRNDPTVPTGTWTWAKVTAEPIGYNVAQPNAITWWRVRSIGYEPIPGSGVLAGESKDVALRKLDLKYDHRESREGNQVAVQKQMASRLVEVVIKPVGAFRAALFGDDRIDMNNHNIVVDSYDSRDPNKSTAGFYDPAKRQQNGDIVTNGNVIDVGNAHINGDASTNAGNVLRASNVTGQIRSDFYQELFPVTRPVMTADFGSPSTVNSSTVLTAKPGTPSQFILNRIHLGGPEVLRIAGAVDGSPTYAQILVNGDVDMSGQSQIILDPGVHVRMFVVGDGDFTGGGVANPNDPLSFQVYGVEQLPDASGNVEQREFKVAGNGGFRGALYAPNYDINFVGGGNTDSIFGAFVGKKINMTGVQSVHYDEALGDGGLYSDYKIVSWFEDTR
jgi:hypothetical protein